MKIASKTERIASRYVIFVFFFSFKPFIPTPEWLKSFADRINALRVELDKIGENAEEMKPKENQILAEVSVL